MIGKAYVSVIQFYDKKTGKRGFKRRPILIIGQADGKDFIVLPISRVTNRTYLNPHYDIELDVNLFPYDESKTDILCANP